MVTTISARQIIVRFLLLLFLAPLLTASSSSSVSTRTSGSSSSGGSSSSSAPTTGSSTALPSRPSPRLCNAPAHGVRLREDRRYSYLSNGYVCMALDRLAPSIVHLAGDFTGRGRYGKNTLAGPGITLETMLASGSIVSSTTVGRPEAQVRVKHLPPSTTTTDKGPLGAAGPHGNAKDADSGIELTVSGIASPEAAVRETWTLVLQPDSRVLEFRTEGSIKRPNEALLVRHSYSLAPPCIYSLYQHGVVQMKDQYDTMNYYVSDDPLPLLYTLGGPGSGTLDAAGNVSLTIERTPILVGGAASHHHRELHQNLTVMGSRKSSSSIKGAQWRTLFQEIVASGAYEGHLHRWRRAMEDQPPTQPLPAHVVWATKARLSPNDGDFPVNGLTTGPNLPERDIRALLTGLYATPVGCLNTHYNTVGDDEQRALIATGVHYPNAPYDNAFNFFDPDNYLTTAALLLSGDTFLQHQARLVLERSGAFLSDDGQVPHHFVGADAIFTAISGEHMSGPNIFWVLSCLNYAKMTGDLPWLKAYMPKLRHASSFLLGMLDADKGGLASASSSLFIDVLVRGNFSTDTNAMLVGFFNEFADAEHAVGNSTGAVVLRSIASTISASMRRLLWDTVDDDHFVTQMNKDGSLRDRVDYDANLIALAHGVLVGEEARARKLLARIDRGVCTHARATWVSEVLYQGKGDVVDERGWTGDAVCAMGRIGWFDALARRRYHDLRTFDKELLEPLVSDLLAWTWMHERYGCDGRPQTTRAAYYFEYPSVVVMMLRDIRYGITLGYRSVTIRPFGPRTFSYHIGNVHVDYTADEGVTLSLGGMMTGPRTFAIHGMRQGAGYVITTRGEGSSSSDDNKRRRKASAADGDGDGGSSRVGVVVAERAAEGGAEGVVTFDAVVGPGVVIEVRRQEGPIDPAVVVQKQMMMEEGRASKQRAGKSKGANRAWSLSKQ